MRPAQTVVLSCNATGHIRKSSCAWGRHRVMHYSVWAVYVLSLWYASVCVLFTLSSGDVSRRMKHCNCHDWLSDQFNRHFIIQGEKHSKPFPPPPLSLPCSLTPLFFCLSLSFSLALALQSSLRSVVDKQFEVSLKLNSILAVGGAGEERSRDSSSGPVCRSVCVCVCVCVCMWECVFVCVCV